MTALLARAVPRIGPGAGRARVPLTPHQRRWLLVILAVGALVRLVWTIYATREPISLFVSGDPYAYYFYGQELAAGRGYVNILNGEPTAYYPVGYPAILAVLFWIVQHTPIPDNLVLTGTLLNAALGTLSIGLVFVIARRILGIGAALVAAGIVAVFPSLVIYVATLQLETVFIFLVLAAVAVLVTHDWSTGPPSRGRLVAFGLVLGLSVLVRPFSLPILFVLGVALLIARCGWRRAAAAVGLATIATVAVVAPWTIRNWVVMDAFVPFSTNTGDGLCIDRSLDATGTFRWSVHEGCASGIGVPAEEYEVHQNRENTRLGLEFIRDHPGKELELVGRRAWFMMEHDHDGVTAVEVGRQRPFLGHRLRTILSTSADWFFYVVAVLADRIGPVRVGVRPMRSSSVPSWCCRRAHAVRQRPLPHADAAWPSPPSPHHRGPAARSPFSGQVARASMTG
ncbi:MAG: glycosyltransferase family 39 protein [Acidimicrobiales bacterium]